MTTIEDLDFEVVRKSSQSTESSDSFVVAGDETEKTEKSEVSDKDEKRTEGEQENDEDKKIEPSEDDKKVEEVTIQELTDEQILGREETEEEKKMREFAETDGEKIVEAMLEKPLTPAQERYFNDDVTRSAITKLVGFSAAMFTIPLAAMYISYTYLFTDYFEMDKDSAMKCSAGVAVFFVILIAGTFVYSAYLDEVDAERVMKEGLPEEKETEEKEKVETKKDK